MIRVAYLIFMQRASRKKGTGKAVNIYLPQLANLTLKAPSCVADCMAKSAEVNHSNVKCFMNFFLRNSTRFIKKQKLFISLTIVNDFFFKAKKINGLAKNPHNI